VTEYDVWCSSCENNGGGIDTWDYARGSARYLLYHLANGASAGLVWEGYDNQYNYYNPGQWSYWGLFGVNDINASPRTYAPRKTFYTLAQIAKFIRPGSRRILIGGSTLPFPLQAFHHPGSGQLTLSGINPENTSTILSGVLTNLPAVTNFDLYYTSSATNLCHGASVPVANRAFNATVPPNCVFTLVSATAVGPALLRARSVTNGIALSWPASLTNYILEAITNLLPSSNWSRVTNLPQRTGELQTVTLPASSDGRFYGLHLQ
jgi:hypothetical protein